jgi:hypothetical protein
MDAHSSTSVQISAVLHERQQERIDSNLLTPLRIDFKVIAAPEVERGYHRVDKLMIVRTRRVRGANG